jgi:hypothetical protein
VQPVGNVGALLGLAREPELRRAMALPAGVAASTIDAKPMKIIRPRIRNRRSLSFLGCSRKLLKAGEA